MIYSMISIGWAMVETKRDYVFSDNIGRSLSKIDLVYLFQTIFSIVCGKGRLAKYRVMMAAKQAL